MASSEPEAFCHTYAMRINSKVLLNGHLVTPLSSRQLPCLEEAPIFPAAFPSPFKPQGSALGRLGHQCTKQARALPSPWQAPSIVLG